MYDPLISPPRTSFSEGLFSLKKGEPYHFTHLIILSRVYHLSEEEESVLANSASTSRSRPHGTPNQKKQRPQENGPIERPPDGIYSFHPEDDIIMTVCAKVSFCLALLLNLVSLHCIH